MPAPSAAVESSALSVGAARPPLLFSPAPVEVEVDWVVVEEAGAVCAAGSLVAADLGAVAGSSVFGLTKGRSGASRTGAGAWSTEAGAWGVGDWSSTSFFSPAAAPPPATTTADTTAAT